MLKNEEDYVSKGSTIQLFNNSVTLPTWSHLGSAPKHNLTYCYDLE